MRRVLLLLLVLAPFAAQADERAEALAKEQARIKKRKELKQGFNSVAKLVAERIEEFALQHVRRWDSAVQALLKERPEALADPLRYYMLDEDWEVQAFACYLCGRTNMAALLPELEQTFVDARYPIIRRKAVEAAASFAKRDKVAAATSLLHKGLEDAEPGVRRIAVEGCEWLDDQDALRKATKDKDHDTRYRAQGALARLGDTDAQRALLSGFRSYVSSRDMQRRASLEIEDVGERYSQFLNAITLGYWGGGEGVTLLGKALLRHKEYRNKLFLSIGSAAALGKSRPTDAGVAAARDRLLKLALGDGDAVIRAMGAFGTGFTHDPQFLRALQRLLKDAQTDVSHNAVEALGRIPGTEAVAMLASVIKTERDVPVRMAAVRALARHPEPEAIPALARALKDKRYMVRTSAARMLGRRGPDAKPAVKALVRAARDPDYGVREAAVVALARIGSPDGLPGLLGALKDRDQGVRIRALRSLARFPRRDLVAADKKAVLRMVQLLVTARERVQRVAARECLLRVRPPLAVPPLLKELESNNYSRRTAAFSVLRNYNSGKTMQYAPQLEGTSRRKAVARWEQWWEDGGLIAPLPPPPKKRANQDLPSFHRYTRDLRWRGIDLVLAYDSTGSMIPVIRAVKQRLDLLIEESTRIVPNLRLSLFTYRDVGEEYVFYGTPLTYATENLKAFVQVAEANRGGDLPEAVTSTVKAAIKRLDWRAEAQKVIVVIGDAPYHPENAGTLFGLAREFSKKENRGTIHAIYTDPNRLGESITARRKRDDKRTRYPFLDRLAEMAKAGGGRAVTIEDTEMLITEILVLSFGEQWRAELESRLDFE